ncbi:MAG: YifB family Mg chelatase-like AAA ATPase [Clostridiaceae bacterium]|nr:YifB family Mg chelatase-like AAA ATPase [Clostridiaceae bacterium]
MLSKVKSCGLLGIDGYMVNVETDINNGLPSFEIVGLGDTAVKEAKERVRAAIKNSGFEFPMKRITVNLAPADLRKEGSALDLPIAIGILTATGSVSPLSVGNYIITGELSLDGGIKPIKGALSMALCAVHEGIKNFILPVENADEAAVVKGLNVLPANNIRDVADHLNGVKGINSHCIEIEEIYKNCEDYEHDFCDVKGQENVKRALEIVAAGSHSCLMVGPPGSGKTMLARRLPTILPPLTFEEALEVTRIYSIAGYLPAKTPLITKRPFRSPHHTISAVALTGGGKYPKPGEISLAHNGVLFLDEIPEFDKKTLEAMRQPLEDGHVTISRLNASIVYPSKTTLILAANPCPCGNASDPSKACTCTPWQVRNYLGKLSGPLLDRVDLYMEIFPVKYKELDYEGEGEKSGVIRERVVSARKMQIERYKGLNIYSNSQLQPNLINKFCKLDNECKALIKNAYEKLGLSARAYGRILKVSRTIADLDGKENIELKHLAEAIQYRVKHG